MRRVRERHSCPLKPKTVTETSLVVGCVRRNRRARTVSRPRVKQMRPRVSSGFFHTACVDFLSVSTSVLLLLSSGTVASLSLASLHSFLSAARRHQNLFGTSCQRLTEQKHGDPLFSMITANSTGSVVNVAFRSSVAKGTNQPD